MPRRTPEDIAPIAVPLSRIKLVHLSGPIKFWHPALLSKFKVFGASDVYSEDYWYLNAPKAAPFWLGNAKNPEQVAAWYKVADEHIHGVQQILDIGISQMKRATISAAVKWHMDLDSVLPLLQSSLSVFVPELDAYSIKAEQTHPGQLQVGDDVEIWWMQDSSWHHAHVYELDSTNSEVVVVFRAWPEYDHCKFYRNDLKWRPLLRLPLASASEMGEKWNFNGRRTWEWSDDGVKYNGWIQFCADGVLRTSLCPEGRGTWSFEEQSSFIVRSKMTVTFGNVMYDLMLMPNSPGCFRVTSRWVTGKQLAIIRENNSERRGPPTQQGRIRGVEAP